MSAYTDWPGRYTLNPDGKRTASLPLIWDIGKPGSGDTVIVPTEFRHDVSVPTWLRWLFRPDDPRYQRAARLHDWLLTRGWSPWTAAAIFYDALKADGVSRWRRWAMALGALLYTAERRWT